MWGHDIHETLMPFPVSGRPVDIRMEQAALSLSVVDVYDVASSIGKEFEKLIDTCGPDTVSELIPKVILVLEHLEVLATKNNKENEEVPLHDTAIGRTLYVYRVLQIADLRYTVDRLQAEKQTKAEERERYELELEQIEDSWRQETQELWSSVSRLQEDNKKLRGVLSTQEKAAQVKKTEDDEEEVMRRMKDTVDKQKDYIKALQKELVQKTCDIDAMQSQVERLSRLNADYKRKTNLTQRQAHNLIQEKAELQAQIHDKEQQIAKVRESMESDTPSVTSPLSDDERQRLVDHLQLEGKLVIDAKDPNRPRFTLNELKEVLQERNELKTKLGEVEEELQAYKPGPTPQDMFDLPVYGPINKEPEDKLMAYPRDESGVRKFFAALFRGRRKSASPMK